MAEVVINVRAEDSFSSVLGNFGNIMTGIKSAIDLAGQAFGVFRDFAMQGLDAVAEYERLSLVLDTLVAKELLMSGEALNMAHALQSSGDQAQQLLVWVEQLAIKSPFTSEGVARAFQMAMAYGFSADEAKRLTEALINFAAGSGASEEAMSRIALALGQIEAKGKLSGQEILQLVNAGLPVTQILAEAFGKTTAEVTKMVTEGLVPADKAIQAITEYLETNFAGAAERQALSWAGLRSTFEDISRIGLRTFFEDMFTALQPVAIALADFLQTEGMEKLRLWGEYLGIFTQALVDITSGNKLYDLGASLQSLGGTDSFFYALGTAMRVFQQNIDDGMPSFTALQIAVGKFASLTGIEIDSNSILTMADSVVANFVSGLTTEVNSWVNSDGPDKLSESIISWFDDIGTGSGFDSKALTAVGNLIAALDRAIADVDWSGIVTSIDQALARKVGETDWTAAGAAFSESIDRAFELGGGDWNDPNSEKFNWVENIPFMIALRFLDSIFNSEAFKSIDKAITDWFMAALDPYGERWNWLDTFGDTLLSLLLPVTFFTKIYDKLVEVGKDMWEGLIDGLDLSSFDAATWVREKIIDPVKRFLGIASPSSVFKGIGGDIIAGLLAGLGAAWDSVTTWFETKFTTLLENLTWENILKIVSGDMELSDLFTSAPTGSVGGRSGGGTIPGGDTTGTTLTGTTTNTFNFYGTVYMSGVGPEGTFDCPSPHPIMIASSQSLLTSGVA